MAQKNKNSLLQQRLSGQNLQNQNAANTAENNNYTQQNPASENNGLQSNDLQNQQSLQNWQRNSFVQNDLTQNNPNQNNPNQNGQDINNQINNQNNQSIISGFYSTDSQNLQQNMQSQGQAQNASANGPAANNNFFNQFNQSGAFTSTSPDAFKINEEDLRSQNFKETPEEENNEEVEEDEEEGKARKFSLFTRLTNFILAAACIYVLILIYGVAMTSFGYNDDGEVEAVRMSVSDIAELESFNDIYYQYLKCRSLYEETLLLDYRIEKGEEDAMTVATEYEALLDEVENLSVKTEAMVVDSKYTQIQSLMLEWIQDDIAVYLQNMSAAISENDSETAANALEDQTRVYSNFSTLTMNIAAIGETIKGADIDDLDEWSPEDYIDEEINGG